MHAKVNEASEDRERKVVTLVAYSLIHLPVFTAYLTSPYTLTIYE